VEAAVVVIGGTGTVSPKSVSAIDTPTNENVMRNGTGLLAVVLFLRVYGNPQSTQDLNANDVSLVRGTTTTSPVIDRTTKMSLDADDRRQPNSIAMS